jgi:hypothetical protein
MSNNIVKHSVFIITWQTGFAGMKEFILLMLHVVLYHRHTVWPLCSVVIGHLSNEIVVLHL